MPQIQEYDCNEFCPSCGEFVVELNDESGWCNLCSGITPSTHCRRCTIEGRVTLLGANNGLCNQCKYLVWLETNADTIDRTMAERNCNAATAKKFVLHLNRAICLSCSKPIKGGTKDRHLFCTKTAKCRKAQHAYRYYKHRKGWSREKAIERALYICTVEGLLESIVNRSN